MTHARPCNSCGHLHVFKDAEGDRDDCPRCGGCLYPIASPVTEAQVATAAACDDLAEIVEGALDEEVSTIWSRVEDTARGETAKVTDAAGRIAAHILKHTRPTIDLVLAARTFARITRARTHEDSVIHEATHRLQEAATALEYGCRQCGSQLVRLDADRLCRDCAPPAPDPDREFDARCRDALAAFKADGNFAANTRAIVEERPQLTMVEFIERATRGRTAP